MPSSLLQTLTLAAYVAADPIIFNLRSGAAASPARQLTAGRHWWNKRATSEIPLTDLYTTADLQWYATISVGTPPQNLTVLIDTGSDFLILPRNNCTTCGNVTGFDPAKSSSFTSQPGTPQILPFGTGADTVPVGHSVNVSGAIITDTVSLGSFSVPGQTFLLQDVGDPSVDSVPIDGILGMPPVPISAATNGSSFGTPFFWQLASAGQLSSTVFSLLLNSNSTGADHGGQLTLGGIDDSKHDGSINYIGLNQALVQMYGEWLLGAPAMAVNGVAVAQNNLSVALVDTGTAYMLAPDFNTTKAIYAAISPQIRQIDPNGAWGAECSVMDSLSPQLTFMLADTQGNSVNLTVDKNSFNLGPYPGQSGICQGVFLNPVPPFNLSVPFWTLGSPLLKAYYTVWDAANLRVGFANLKTSSPAGNSSNAGGGSASSSQSPGIGRNPESLLVWLAAGAALLIALI